MGRRQTIIQKKVTPLHNVLGSRTITPAKIQSEIPKRTIKICHISDCPLILYNRNHILSAIGNDISFCIRTCCRYHRAYVFLAAQHKN